MYRRRLRVRPRAAVAVTGRVLGHPANRRSKGRALARTLHFQARARLLGRPTEVRFAERSRVIARLDGAGSKRAAYAPLPDWNEMRAWQRHLRAGDLFVDVGANVGLYSLLACEVGCEVISVEPLEATRRQLEENLRLNGYSAVVIAEAVGAEPTTMRLVGPDALRQRLDPGGSEGIEVGVTTLDDLVGDRVVAGVKVDVEGAERQVLIGAQRALSDQRIALLQLEWNDTARANFGESRAEVAELLDDNGYELLRPDVTGALVAAPLAAEGEDVFARPRR